MLKRLWRWMFGPSLSEQLRDRCESEGRVVHVQVGGEFSSGGFKEIDATDMPFWFEFNHGGYDTMDGEV